MIFFQIINYCIIKPIQLRNVSSRIHLDNRTRSRGRHFITIIAWNTIVNIIWELSDLRDGMNRDLVIKARAEGDGTL